jgi:UDP-N-acetylglucosamine--dolichyl-phosphate N-acetylglucosaminephosphotransferase
MFRFDPATGLLHPSKTQFARPPSELTTFILRVFTALGLTDLVTHPTSGIILEANNLTILNFFLLRFGPMNEKRLVQVLIGFQVSSVMEVLFLLFY